MPLNALQKQFIVAHLGVQPRPRKTLFRTSDEKQDDSIAKAAQDYTRREGKVLAALAELEKVPGADSLLARFENQVGQIQARIKGAVRDAGESVLRECYQALESIKKAVRTEVGHEAQNPDFIARREALTRDLAALRAHRRVAHVQGLIDKSAQDLQAAIDANDGKKYPLSIQKLDAARLACDQARTAADAFDTYRIARAPAEGILARMKGMYADNTVWTGFQAKLAQADLDATVAAGKYAIATTHVQEIVRDMTARRKAWLDGALKKLVDALKLEPQVAFVDDSLQKLITWQGQVAGLVASGNFAALDLIDNQALREQVGALDRARGRQGYLQARLAAEQALAPAKACAPLATQAGLLETRLSAEADPLAVAATLRFEEGKAICLAVETAAKALAPTVDAANRFLKAQKALDLRLQALQKLPVAARIGQALAGVLAAQALAVMRTPADAPDWLAGQAALDAMDAALKVAEQLAATLSGPVATEAAIATAKTPDDITKTVASLRAQALLLEAAPYPTLLAKSLLQIRGDCDKALELAKAGDPGQAAALLAEAGRLVVEGHQARALKQSSDQALLALTQRQESLQENAKAEPYLPLATPLLELKLAVEEAGKAAAGSDPGAFQTALAQAHALAARIDAAALSLNTCADRAKKLAERTDKARKAGANVAAIEALQLKFAAALKLLDFKVATGHLDSADALVASLDLRALAKANPADPELAKTAAALLKMPGGEALLDKFAETLTDESDFQLLATLAKERFGVDLGVRAKNVADPTDTAKTYTEDASRTLSAQAVWAAMAGVPPLHAKQPSMKKVTLGTPDENSGAFGWVNKEVTMNGRPDNGGKERFDAATRQKALGKPLDHDNANDPYAPVDDQPAELFNMTMLHEIGHAVDDRLAFMRGKAGQAEFGGWLEYTDLAPIVNAVAAALKYEPDYVRLLVNGTTPDPAVMPVDYVGGAAKWERARQAVHDWHQLATQGQIWYSQAKSVAAAIDGVVYQEAYSNRWVSYVLAERSKGVTAYQWRAPGEWFAELYMCWHGKKLKPNHPFAAWLTTL